MNISKAALIIVLLYVIVGFPVNAHSEFYKYVNKDGKISFVDDVGKIPLEYRDQLTVYKEKYDHLSKGERKELLQKDNYEDSLKTDVIIKGNNVLIPVKLGYKDNEIEVMLVLDTGASIITLHQDIAKQLEIRDTQKAIARVVGGKEIKFNMAKLNYIKVGPFEKEDVLVGIIEHQGPSVPHKGLLGMNFLQHFEYIIDFDKQVVRWKPKDGFDWE